MPYQIHKLFLCTCSFHGTNPDVDIFDKNVICIKVADAALFRFPVHTVHVTKTVAVIVLPATAIKNGYTVTCRCVIIAIECGKFHVVMVTQQLLDASVVAKGVNVHAVRGSGAPCTENTWQCANSCVPSHVVMLKKIWAPSRVRRCIRSRPSQNSPLRSPNPCM